ncbi:MAG: hypothetical protein AB7H96_20010 [Vicinamibacterales bacterium]
MAVPWLRLIDAALGVTDVVRRVRARNAPADENRQLVAGASVLGGIEARLAGVVVAALKEAFDRDHQRLELEREQIEAERRRAERALKLELLRLAGEREIARMRLVAGAAVVGWVGTLLLARTLADSGTGRFMLGLGWVLLLAALACGFAEQSRLGRAIAVADDRLSVESATAPGAAGVAAPWLVAAGFAAITIAALV